MTYSRTLKTAVLVLAAASLGLMPTAGFAAKKPKPKTQIKFATLAPEGSMWMNIMHDLDDELRAETENRVGFKFYPGGVQGDEKDVLRKMRIGQIHAGGFTGFGLGAVDTDFRAIEVPFMFKTLDEVDHVRGALDEFFVEMFDKKGYVLLGWADVGFVYLFSNKPIQDPQTLQAAKMWTWSGDKLAAIFFDAFDVSPIPLALPDVLTSIQMGVIDAVYAPPLACIALQWFTRVKYMTDIPITYGFGAMLASKKSLAKLSPEDIATLNRLARKHSATLIEKTRVQNVEAIVEIKGEGIEVLAIEPNIYSTFFTTGRGAWKNGVGDLYSQEMLDRVSALVDDYRSNNGAASGSR
jgi:TRAP-type C4-dicarboxylate transport system substrate-binding protein